MAELSLKARVVHQDPVHTEVMFYTALDGEGDVPGHGYQNNGKLVFGTDEWDTLSVRFEAMGAVVER